VTGVDISPVQIERARELVPSAGFLCADMTEVSFPPGSFDAVLALYSIIHVPLEEQEGLFGKIARWMKAGGWLLCTVGHREWTGTEQNWLDVEGGTMYWSHADEATYRRWLEGSGFYIEERVFLPEGEGGHTAFLASLDAR
jgi:SAM-dependent methyltransferase